MPHAGSDILAALEDSALQFQGEIETLRARRGELDSQIEELIERRSAAIEDLAQHYLPELSEEAVGRTFRDVRRKLQDVLGRRRNTISQLTKQVDQDTQRAVNLKAELNEVTDQLDKAVALRDQLQAEVSGRLDADDTFRQLSSEVLKSEQQLARYERQLVESRREAEEKLPAYEESRLFQYLAKRNFGAPNYHGWGLARPLDRWVARLIDYQRAKRSYDFLRTLPELMSDEVGRHRDLLKTASETLQQMQLVVWKETGLDVANQEGDQLGHQRETFVEQLNQLEKALTQAHDELIQAEDKHGTFYALAIDEFQAALADLQSHVLQQRAKATPQEEDDAIVAEIRYLTEELEQTRRQVGETDDGIVRIERQTKGMDYVVSKFRSAEFDSERSTFADPFDIDDQLRRFDTSDINQFGLWRSLKRHQEFAPTWVEKTTGTAVEAMNSPTGQSLITAAGQIAAAALAVAVQKKLDSRGVDMPKIGGKFTKGDGF